MDLKGYKVEKVTDKGLMAQLNKIHTLDMQIRGQYLNQAIAIDSIVSSIISYHFCPVGEKRNQLFSLVLFTPSLSMRSKIGIINRILKSNYPELLDKYPKIIKELENISGFRNKLAHSLLDTSAPYLEKQHDNQIRLAIFKDGEKKPLDITKDLIGKKLQKCTEVLMQLADIQNYIIQQTKPSGEATLQVIFQENNFNSNDK